MRVPQTFADGQSLLAEGGRLLGLTLNDEDHRQIRQRPSPYVERSHCHKSIVRGRSIEIEHTLKARPSRDELANMIEAETH